MNIERPEAQVIPMPERDRSSRSEASIGLLATVTCMSDVVEARRLKREAANLKNRQELDAMHKRNKADADAGKEANRRRKNFRVITREDMK